MLKVLPVLFGFALLTACAPLDTLLPGTAGNPANDAYAGSPGSVYDSSANPPVSLGTVAYDPDKASPLPPDEAAPAAPSGTMTPPAR